MSVRPSTSMSSLSFSSSNKIPAVRPESSQSMISRMSWASGDEYYISEDLASSKRFAVPCLFGNPLSPTFGDHPIPPLYGCNAKGKPLAMFENNFTGVPLKYGREAGAQNTRGEYSQYRSRRRTAIFSEKPPRMRQRASRGSVRRESSDSSLLLGPANQLCQRHNSAISRTDGDSNKSVRPSDRLEALLTVKRRRDGELARRCGQADGHPESGAIGRNFFASSHKPPGQPAVALPREHIVRSREAARWRTDNAAEQAKRLARNERDKVLSEKNRQRKLLVYQLVEAANEKAAGAALAEMKLPRRRKNAQRQVRVTIQVQLVVVRLQRRYRRTLQDRRLKADAEASVAKRKSELAAKARAAEEAAAAEQAALEAETARIMAL